MAKKKFKPGPKGGGGGANMNSARAWVVRELDECQAEADALQRVLDRFDRKAAAAKNGRADRILAQAEALTNGNGHRAAPPDADADRRFTDPIAPPTRPSTPKPYSKAVQKQRAKTAKLLARFDPPRAIPAGMAAQRFNPWIANGYLTHTNDGKLARTEKPYSISGL